MDDITRDRLVEEGRTRWFCIRIAKEGRRFPIVVHRWARDADDARDQVAALHLSPGETIITVEEQHR